MIAVDLSALPELPEGRAYLAVVSCGWGRSANAAEALSIAVRQGAYFGEEPLAYLYDVDGDVTINGLGRVEGDARLLFDGPFRWAKDMCGTCRGDGWVEVECDECHAEVNWKQAEYINNVRLCPACASDRAVVAQYDQPLTYRGAGRWSRRDTAST